MEYTASFNIDIASKVGVEEAILYDWIVKQCFIAKVSDTLLASYEDSWWVCCPDNMFTQVFPFWTASQIGTRLRNLTVKGLIKRREGATKDIAYYTPLDAAHVMQPATRRVRKVKQIPAETKEESVREYLRLAPDGTREKVTTTTGKLVNEMIDLFKHVNPSFDSFFAKPAQRKAIERMLDRYSISTLFELLKILPQSNGMAYGPTITTPIEFERLAPKLVAFIKKKRDEDSNGFTVSL